MSHPLIAETKQALASAQRILVISHIRPDGDAVGSLLGLGLALQEVGKDVQMVLTDGVPSSFRFLKGSEQICEQPSGEFDLIAVVDCSELGRIGNVLQAELIPDINIDHHITNSRFARLNIVDTEAAATTEVLTHILPQMDLKISQPVAQALITGIVTDTLGFRTAGTTSNTMRLAADLMEAGANLFECYWHSLLKRSYTAARYWGVGLSNIEREGRMVWTTLRLSDRQAVGYPGRDDADLINTISAINEADISLIFVEQSNERVKVSWRAQPGYDVSQLAMQFGGGGHIAAAGADIQGKLEKVQNDVLEATRKILHKVKDRENEF